MNFIPVLYVLRLLAAEKSVDPWSGFMNSNFFMCFFRRASRSGRINGSLRNPKSCHCPATRANLRRENAKYRNRRYLSQIREQMSDPDLYVFTLKFLVLKKPGFSLIKNNFQNFLTLVYLYFMQLFSADPKIFSKNNVYKRDIMQLFY